MQEYLLVEERSAFSMLPPPLNLIPSALAIVHYPLIYIYQLQQSQQSKVARTKTQERLSFSGRQTENALPPPSPREQEDIPHKKVLSVSGTASDMVVG